LDLKCPANVPEARSGREGTLQGYRDYFRIADHPDVDAEM
jgi:hypothetical protein